MSISGQASRLHRRPIEATLTRLAVLLLLLGHGAMGRAAVQSYLQRDTISSGESVTLRIESDRVQSGLQPDLTPLKKDFEVLGTSTSSQMQIINGKRSEKTGWLVQLQPRHGGTLEIPPISVGDEQTPALSVTVREPSAQDRQAVARHLFLEDDRVADGRSVYVQQQIPYTARLYFDDTIRSGELSAPTSDDAVIEQLGEETRSKAMRNGHLYNVVERHYAISPEKSGTLHIAPARFRGTALREPDPSGSANTGNNPFADMLRNTPFANDPMFMRSFGADLPFGDPGQPVDIRGRDMALHVQPRPAQATGDWLPAEQITLHDSWQDHAPQFRVGEPVTRTITIEAKGLAASQIPALALTQPAAARLYPDAPQNQSRTDGRTIYGISKQDVTYIPDAQGTLTVAPVSLAWWNTTTHMQSQATLPARVFQVAPGAMPPASQTLPLAGKPAAPPVKVATGTAPTGWDRFAGTGHRTAIATALLLALGTGLWWLWLHARRPAPPAQPPAGTPAAAGRRSVLRALRHACKNHQAQAAAQALLDLARLEWPENPPRGLGALATRLETGAAQVHALDRHLYGTDAATPWQGDALWKALGRGLQPRNSPSHGAEEGLQALYRP